MSRSPILYLDALEAALTGGEPTRPWSIAFGAPADLPALRHVLLGMNAHINYDLPQALLAVISDEQFDDPVLLARREADHRAIDNVLASRVAAEDDELTSVSGPVTLLDRLLRPFNRLGTQRFLREARQKVWANAIALSRARRQGPDTYAAVLARAGRTQRRQGRGPAGTRPGPAQARRHRLRRPAAGPGQRTVDIAELATCNDEVFDRAREAADVVAAGPPRSPRPGGPFWLLVLALTAALIVSITVALHYRAEAGRTPTHVRRPPACRCRPCPR